MTILRPAILRRISMAKKEIVSYSYVCDICGKDADESHKITFGSGSRPAVWEIDVCAADSKKLAKAEFSLVALLSQGRKTGGSRQRAASGTRPRASSKRSADGDAAAIRDWARQEGYEVSDRGRVSAALREAYANAK
jgi:hypothetical protein